MVHRPPSALVAVALCCLVGLLACTGVAAATPDVTAESNETLGNVVELTVSVPANGTATVVVSSTDSGEYNRTIELTDASGDGTVTLRINTFLEQQGANETAVYSAVDGDTATVRESSGTELSATAYAVAVYNGTDTNGSPAGTTTVELTAPTDGTISYLTGPAYASSQVDTVADIRRGRHEGWLNDAANVTTGETLVLALDVDGLGGALVAGNASNDTERFHTMLDRPNTTLQVEAQTTPQVVPERFSLNRSNIATVAIDRPNETYYVVVETTGTEFTPANSDWVDDGEELYPRVTIAGESRLAQRRSNIGPFRLYTADSVGAEFEIAVDDPPRNETLGDVVELGMWLPGNETATVVVNATDDTYEERIEVVDRSGDGSVAVTVNTFLGARNADGVYGVGPGDEATVTNQTNTAMTAGDYRVTVYAGGNTTGEPVVSERVNLSAPTYGNVTVMHAPGNRTERLDTLDAVQAAREEGWLTEATEVTSQDTLVWRIHVGGIGGAVTPADNETAPLDALLSRPNTTLQAMSGFGQTHVLPTTVTLDNTSAMTLVPDRANDTYYVVMATDSVRRPLESARDFDDGDSVESRLTVAGRHRLTNVSEYYADTTTFEIWDAEVELTTDARDSLDWDGVTIRGETNVAPGTHLIVRFVANNTTVASWNGTVGTDGHARVAVPTVPSETLRQYDNMTLEVASGGTTLMTVSDHAPLTVPSNQSLDDGQLSVASVTLPEEGYIHVVGPEGTVVGTSDSLTEGQHSDVAIPVSVTSVGPDESLVVVPAAGNIDPDSVGYDEAFLVDGPPAGVVVNVTDAAEADTPTETDATTASPTTPQRTDSGTAASLRTESTTTAATRIDTPTTGADGPGFGVSTAFLAVLLALVVRTHHEE